MTDADILDDDLKEPAAACSDLGIAAVICFHRGDLAAARDYLAAAEAHVRQLGNRVLGPLALARSLDHEHAHASARRAFRADGRVFRPQRGTR